MIAIHSIGSYARNLLHGRGIAAGCAVGLLALAASTSQLCAQTNTFPSTGNTGIGTTTPAYPLVVYGNVTGNLVKLENTSASGLSALGVYSNINALQAGFGYGNTSSTSPNAALAGKAYLWSSGGTPPSVPATDFVIDAGNFATPTLYVSGSTGAVGIGAGISSNNYPTQALQVSPQPDLNLATMAMSWIGQPGSIGFDAYNGNNSGYIPMAFAATSFAFMGGTSGSAVPFVGIGTSAPVHPLQVIGTIGATEVIVSSTGADYVFKPNYKLAPLKQVAAYIDANHHLPEIPSAAEVQQKGVNLGEMQTKLLAKVEELTLHMIQEDERNSRLERKNRQLQKRIARIEASTAKKGSHSKGNNGNQ